MNNDVYTLAECVEDWQWARDELDEYEMAHEQKKCRTYVQMLRINYDEIKSLTKSERALIEGIFGTNDRSVMYHSLTAAEALMEIER